MDIVMVGSVALDDVHTPAGEVQNALGGSAVYASLAASAFAAAGIVGVVGNDFSNAHVQLLARHGIRLEGLEYAPGLTFHWSGRYEGDMSSAQTLSTDLNVFADFSPKIPAEYTSASTLFLANIDPDLQIKVLNQVRPPRFTLLDTMNHWIANKRPALLQVMRRVDMMMVNDAEARQLTGHSNLMHAATWIREQGPRGVVIKKGEHGAMLFWENQLAIIPAFPLAAVKDPTGAGDTCAGGFLGALTRLGSISLDSLKIAAVVGAVMASFTVEDFSVGRLAALALPEVEQRYEALRGLAGWNQFPKALR